MNSYNVSDREERKIKTESATGRRINRPGAGGSLAASQHIGTDYKISIAVQTFSRTDESVPPAVFLFSAGVVSGSMSVAGQCVTNKNGVAGSAVQRSVGLIRYGNRAKFCATCEFQRPATAE